jgi:hypothetical protein
MPSSGSPALSYFPFKRGNHLPDYMVSAQKTTLYIFTVMISDLRQDESEVCRQIFGMNFTYQYKKTSSYIQGPVNTTFQSNNGPANLTILIDVLKFSGISLSYKAAKACTHHRPTLTFEHILNTVISVTGYSPVSAVHWYWPCVLLMCSSKLYKNCYST